MQCRGRRIFVALRLHGEANGWLLVVEMPLEVFYAVTGQDGEVAVYVAFADPGFAG